MKNSVENLAIKAARSEEIQKRDAKARAIVNSAEKPLLSDGDLRKFTELYGGDNPDYSERAVSSDLHYVEEKRKWIAEKHQDTTLPHAVEYLAQGWMDGGKMFETGHPLNENPPASKTHDYDDFANGVDVVKAIRLFGEDADDCGTDSLTMALDVTISGNEDTIKGKLDPFDNGLPYGFTRVKYYAEKQKDGSVSLSPDKRMVPRFVIGEDAENVEAILRSGIPENSEEFADYDNVHSLLTRFKILTEMYDQIGLFSSRIPEDDDEKAEMLMSRLDYLAQIVSPALDQCVQKMTPQLISNGNGFFKAAYADPEVPVFNEEETEELKNAKNDQARADIVKKWIRNEEHPRYDATFSRIMQYIDTNW